MLATARLEDDFAVANFRFDAADNRVVPMSSNGFGDLQAAEVPTCFLVLRDGGVYFEGDHRVILDSEDSSLKRFLVWARGNAQLLTFQRGRTGTAHARSL